MPAGATTVAERGRFVLTMNVRPVAVDFGDAVQVEMTLLAPDGAAPEFGELDADGAEVSGGAVRGPVPADEGRSRWWRRLEVRPTVAGELALVARVALEPPDGGVAETLVTNPVTLNVRSALRADDSPREPRPLAGPLELPDTRSRGWVWWLVAGVGLLLLVAGGVWWLRRRRRAVVPADRTAVAALDRLEEALTQGAAPARLYAELSVIARSYVGARTGVAALEMTTEELNAWLANGAAAAFQMQRAALLAVLRACDGVKFAGVAADGAALGGDVRCVRGVIAATRPTGEGAA